MGNFFASKGYKLFMAKLYGWGAAIVIVGALFKIQHLPGAGIMLFVGMSTEAIIFIFSSFEPLHPEIDWTRVYPELADHDGKEPKASAPRASSRPATVVSDPLTQKFGEMMENANITQDLFNNLQAGLAKLTETSTNMNTLANTVASNQNYAQEIDKITANLGKLNEIYMNQIQQTAAQAELQIKMQENMNQIMTALSSSLEDSQKYSAQIGELTAKVTALNDVYGKMLNALTSIKA